jgi:predicted nucleic acid-binding protein
MLIVDASAVVDLITLAPRGIGVARQIVEEELLAPELVDAEVLSAVARQQRAGGLTETEADDAVDRFTNLSLLRASHVLLTEQAWHLRHRMRISDAFYVACAQLMKAALITTDGRLARAPLPGVSILLVS